MWWTYCLVLLVALAYLLTDSTVLGKDTSFRQFEYSDEDDSDDDDYGEFSDRSSYDVCKCKGSFPCFCVMPSLCGPGGTINIHGDPSLYRALAEAEDCPSNEICCAYRGPSVPRTTTSEPQPVPDPEPECGKRGSWPRANYDVHDTMPDEFSWTAAIMRYEGDELFLQCGASLVSPSFVLTAGHCLENVEQSQLLVRAGAWNLSDPSEKPQDRKVFFIIHHPQYSVDPPRNDIALIVVENDFRLGPRVKIVCLPKETMSFPPGTRCIATGWSRGKFGVQGTTLKTLKRAEMPLVDHRICERRLRRTLLGRFFKLHPNFTCAGGEGADTCTGDGGGPLFCEKDESYFQVGVVSWGVGCDLNKLPGIYASVMAALEWIKAQIALYGPSDNSSAF